MGGSDKVDFFDKIKGGSDPQYSQGGCNWVTVEITIDDRCFIVLYIILNITTIVVLFCTIHKKITSTSSEQGLMF